jgi:hypothetical protein
MVWRTLAITSSVCFLLGECVSDIERWLGWLGGGGLATDTDVDTPTPNILVMPLASTVTGTNTGCIIPHRDTAAGGGVILHRKA